MGRKSIPKEVVDYARDLYLTVDEKGERVYSLQDVANEIQRKYNVAVDKSTILRWARKFGWNEMIDEAGRVAAVRFAQKVAPKVVPLEHAPTEQAFESIVEMQTRALQELYETFMLGRELLRKKQEDPKSVKDSFSRLIETTSRAGKIFLDAYREMKESGELQVEKVEVILEGFEALERLENLDYPCSQEDLERPTPSPSGSDN